MRTRINNEIRRRALLLATLSAAVSQRRAHAGARSGGILACAQRLDGRFVALRLDAEGVVQASTRLPGRGHALVVAPDGRDVVVIARRPGNFAVVCDARTLARHVEIEAPPERHFFGHATFDDSGRWLYATENDFARRRGVLGVYDAYRRYVRVGELSSGGVGPHEVVASPDGRALWVANGGIHTHPERPREKLGLDRMRPSLARVEPASGRIVARYELPISLRQLSIRHIAVSVSGQVAVGLQFEGPPDADVPLLAQLAPSDAALVPLDMPLAVRRAMRQYVGSVTFTRDGALLLATAPRGNLAAAWRPTSEGRLEFDSYFDAHDVGGVCASDKASCAWLTGGDGVAREVFFSPSGAYVLASVRHAGVAFDNHSSAAS